MRPRKISMKEKALALARRGLAVFPCAPGAKRPLHKGGFHEATTNEFQIEAWWAEEPDANPAIYPAACNPPLLVVDLDEKAGANGRATWEALKLYDGLGVQVHTPSGGEHRYFRLPEGAEPVQSNAGRLGAGIDVRCAGGYVLAPGAIVDGVPYSLATPDFLTHGTPAPEAPEALLAACRGGMEKSEAAQEWLVEPDLPVNIERAMRWLAMEAAHGRVAVSGQGGNDMTYRTAEVLRDLGVGEEKAGGLLLDAWNPKCLPPWEEDDLLGIVANAYAYAKRPAGTKAVSIIEPPPDEIGPVPGVDAVRPEDDPPEVRPKKAGLRDHLVTVTQLLNEPPMRWAVEGLLPELGIMQVYGPFGSYKSFLSLDMALSRAAGRPVLGHRCAPLDGSVVYMAGEGVGGLSQRVKAWIGANGPISDGSLYLLKRMPLFADPDQFRETAALLAEVRCRMLFLDTLAHATAGLDENSTRDAGLFVARLFELRDYLQATIGVVHHAGKDLARGSRGSSAFPAAWDTVLEVESPSHGTCRVTMTKQRDAEKWKAPIGLAAVASGPSIVLREDQSAAKSSRAEQHTMWAMAAIEALRDAPALPVKRGELAREIARRTVAGEAWETVVPTIEEWLRRTAHKGPLEGYAASLSSGGHATTYTLPDA